MDAGASGTPAAYSRFLPAGFDPVRPICVIAGQALYPELTIRAIRAAGLPIRLIAFEGETREEIVASFAPDERAIIKVGQLGKMLKAMRSFGVGYAVMVGQVTPRRLFNGLHPDLKAIQLLATLKERNAETIFGAISGEIEKLGVTMLDARAFLDDQMAEPGWMAGPFEETKEIFVEHGIRIARESARLDIGQSVVVRKGTVIAVEAFEGTDETIARAGTYKTDELILVKTTKPGQDYRFDVPCFGEKTLDAMNAAGVRTACIEAGSVIILDRPNVLAAAKRLKIGLLGF